MRRTFAVGRLTGTSSHILMVEMTERSLRRPALCSPRTRTAEPSLRTQSEPRRECATIH
jgi:hypothetical protein